MPYTPEQYYFDFSNDFCDPDTRWGERKLTWGKGAAWDMEGFTHLMKLLPYPCYGSYIEGLQQNPKWIKLFADFRNSGKDKLALPYKFLQMLDPDAFKEIQQTHYHSVSHAVRNAADLSRACDIFFRAKYYDSTNAFYEWEARGATEVMYHVGKNSLVKNLLSCGIDILATGETQLSWMGGDKLSCAPLLLGAQYRCICLPGGICPPKLCAAGGDIECEKKSGYSKSICANEPKPPWPTGNASLGSGFAVDPQYGYQHLGYFVRKSYGGYVNLIKEAGKLYSAKDIELLAEYANQNNGFEYTKTKVCPIFSRNLYGDRQSLATDPKTGQLVAQINEAGLSDSLPVKRLKYVMKVDNADNAKDFLYNGYGVVLSTNVGFSRERDSIGISYPDRIWYHTMAIIGYDDTRRLHPDCLFLIQNSWGNWNYGGHPDWGPLPQGSFLITGQHLDCILSSRPKVEQIDDCNEISKKRCIVYSQEDVNVTSRRPPTSVIEAQDTSPMVQIDRSENIKWVRFNCSNAKVFHTSQKSCERALYLESKETNNCGDNCYAYDSCEYRQCGGNQSPWGIAFALSFDSLASSIPFRRKDFRYEQFFYAKKYDADICVDNAVSTGKSSWNTSGISKTMPSTIVFKTAQSQFCEGTAIGQQYGRIDCFIDVDIDSKNTYAEFSIQGKLTQTMIAKFIINDETTLLARSAEADCAGEDIHITQTIKLKPGRNKYSAIVDAGYHYIGDFEITFSIAGASA